MPAALSNWMPSATTRPPIQAASTGLWAWAAALPTACGRGRRIGHRLRRENHQHGVDVLVFQHDLHGLGEAVGRGVAQHVDRIAVRPADRAATR